MIDWVGESGLDVWGDGLDSARAGRETERMDTEEDGVDTEVNEAYEVLRQSWCKHLGVLKLASEEGLTTKRSYAITADYY